MARRDKPRKETKKKKGQFKGKAPKDNAVRVVIRKPEEKKPGEPEDATD